MGHVAKVIEIVGSSANSWAEAADAAVSTAADTISGITGVSVESMTASVKDGKIDTYRTTVKIAFGVDH